MKHRSDFRVFRSKERILRARGMWANGAPLCFLLPCPIAKWNRDCLFPRIRSSKGRLDQDDDVCWMMVLLSWSENWICRG